MNVKTEVSVVTERGQTSIPAHLRRDLSLAKGRRLAWERVADDELRVKILPEPDSLVTGIVDLDVKARVAKAPVSLGVHVS